MIAAKTGTARASGDEGGLSPLRSGPSRLHLPRRPADAAPRSAKEFGQGDGLVKDRRGDEAQHENGAALEIVACGMGEPDAYAAHRIRDPVGVADHRNRKWEHRWSCGSLR